MCSWFFFRRVLPSYTLEHICIHRYLKIIYDVVDVFSIQNTFIKSTSAWQRASIIYIMCSVHTPTTLIRYSSLCIFRGYIVISYLSTYILYIYNIHVRVCLCYACVYVITTCLDIRKLVCVCNLYRNRTN